MKNPLISTNKWNALSNQYRFLKLYVLDYMAEYSIEYPGYDTVLDTIRLDEGILDTSTLQHSFSYKAQGNGRIVISNSTTADLIMEEEGFFVLSLITFYEKESLEDFILSFQLQCYQAFQQASGDDDTYDYVPHFIYLYENLLLTLGIEDEFLTNFRKTLFEFRPDYPEFFTEEELKLWSNSKN